MFPPRSFVSVLPPLGAPQPGAVGALLATALLAACGGGAGTAATQGDTAPVPVRVVTLAPRSVPMERELPGRALASLVAEVRPQVDGIVRQRLFTEGGVVQAGQALYQLDDATYRAELASSEAALARAQATLQSARLTAERTAALARIHAASRQDDEDAQAALLQAQADVQSAQASVQAKRIQLNYARITAPIAGHIGKSAVTPGALVTAKQSAALATVQRLDPMHIELNQSSAELLQLRKGLAAGSLSDTRKVPVTILLEDGSAHHQQGTLEFSEMSVNPSTGSYLVRLRVPNPDRVLLPGMYVRAVLHYGQREEALLAPQQAITRDPKGNASAWVVGSDGTAQLRQVMTSRTVGDQWLIDSGLKAGERVITQGLHKVQAGTLVTATEAPEATEATETAPSTKPSEPATPALAGAAAGQQ